jgi:hypothetical protein
MSTSSIDHRIHMEKAAESSQSSGMTGSAEVRLPVATKPGMGWVLTVKGPPLATPAQPGFERNCLNPTNINQ